MVCPGQSATGGLVVTATDPTTHATGDRYDLGLPMGRCGKPDKCSERHTFVIRDRTVPVCVTVSAPTLIAASSSLVIAAFVRKYFAVIRAI